MFLSSLSTSRDLRSKMREARCKYDWAVTLLLLINKFAIDLCTALQTSRVSFQSRTVVQVSATPFFTFAGAKQPENIRPRLNGQLLVTVSTAPELYQINPFQNQTGTIVHSFEGYTSLWGIVELEPDTFHVIASNCTSAPQYFGFQGSVSIFKVDLRGISEPASAQEVIRVFKVLDIPQAQLLDGFAIVNQSSRGLLISGDAQTGSLYLIDLKKYAATVVLQDQLLKGTSDESSAGLAHIGINGLKIYGDDLYFTNTAKGFYGKVALDLVTGKPVGHPRILANYSTLVDDLSFDTEGNQFISEPLNGVLFRPANTSVSNNQTRLVTDLPGANSNAGGRTALDKCILYSTFDGTPSGVARIDLARAGLCHAVE